MPKACKSGSREVKPCDAAAFNFRIRNSARSNASANRKLAFSLRLVGDDARSVARPGQTSPPFPGHGINPGERLRED